ncbi:MAG: prephenate dehydrogenase/arogenate dehydrogenase family protein [Alphaproteobacteria bacterium]
MSLFGKVTVIGIGLIGSSLARVIKRDGLARRISCYDVKPQYMQKALELGIVDEIHKNIADSVKNADLIVLSAPVGATAKSSEIARFSKINCHYRRRINQYVAGSEAIWPVKSFGRSAPGGGTEKIRPKPV